MIPDVLVRMWEDIAARPAGPMAFRFVLQPTMAVIFAIRDGRRDARAGRSPYSWDLLDGGGDTMALLREGLAAVLKILILAVVLDLAYQSRVLDTVYPVEAIIVALCLAFLPYVLVRGPVGRFGRRGRAARGAGSVL
jgi:hypothetical protein